MHSENGHAATPVETTELRYLDPNKLAFHRYGAALRVIIEGELCCLKAQVYRAFPLSEPARYLSVRDGANKELGLILDLKALDSEGRRLVSDELHRRYHVPAILRVVAVKERFGTVDWEVETDRGLCRFTTRHLRDSLLRPSPGRFIFTDVEGNRFDIPDIAALDAPSQAWILHHA